MVTGRTGRRLHLREEHSTELVALLSKSVARHMGHDASFVCWSPLATPADPANLDPNYLYERQLGASPWHRALSHLNMHFTAPTGQKPPTPMFLVDIHGKKDRRTELHLDIGVTALRTFWPSKLAVAELCRHLRVKPAHRL